MSPPQLQYHVEFSQVAKTVLLQVLQRLDTALRSDQMTQNIEQLELIPVLHNCLQNQQLFNFGYIFVKVMTQMRHFGLLHSFNVKTHLDRVDRIKASNVAWIRYAGFGFSDAPIKI